LKFYLFIYYIDVAKWMLLNSPRSNIEIFLFVLFCCKVCYFVAQGYKMTDLTSKRAPMYILALNGICIVHLLIGFVLLGIYLQNVFDLKSLKKSPLPLRMVVFAMTMLCGISICSMCMKQLGSDGWSRIVKIEVVEQPCNKSTVPPSEVQFVHYPQPITYSR